MDTQTPLATRRSAVGSIALLLGLLLALVPLAGWNTPATAAEDCSTLTFQAGRVIERVILEADGLTVDTDDAGTTCEQVGNALQIVVDGAPVVIEAGVTDAPNLHTSCSVDYDGVSFTLAGEAYTITQHAFTVSNFPGGSAGTCSTIAPSASMICERSQVREGFYDVTVTFNPGSSSEAFFFTEDGDHEYELARGVETYLTGADVVVTIEPSDGDPVLATLTTAPPACPDLPPPPVPASGTLVCAADDGFLLSYSTALGTQSGTFTIAGPGTEQVVSGDGTLSVASAGTYTLSFDDGEVSETVDTTTCIEPRSASIGVGLVKEVVDAGDVDEIGNFNPAVDDQVDDGLIVWSGEEVLGGAVQTVTYRFTITNIGQDTLFNVVLTDPMLGGVLASGLTLAPGESTDVDREFDIAADDAFVIFEDGSVTPLAIDNTATVEGTDEAEELTATDQDIARVVNQAVFPEEPQELGISLVKEVIEGGDVAEVGDFDDDGDADDGTIRWEEAEVDDGDTKTVVYRFTITNTGNVTLFDIELEDPMLSGEPLVSSAEGLTLAPGASTTVERSYELPAADAWPDGSDGAIEAVDNTATVTGSNEARNASVSDTDDARVVGTLVFDEVLAVAGLTNGALLPISILLMGLGAALLRSERRRRPV